MASEVPKVSKHSTADRRKDITLMILRNFNN